MGSSESKKIESLDKINNDNSNKEVLIDNIEHLEKSNNTNTIKNINKKSVISSNIKDHNIQNMVFSTFMNMIDPKNSNELDKNSQHIPKKFLIKGNTKLHFYKKNKNMKITNSHSNNNNSFNMKNVNKSKINSDNEITSTKKSKNDSEKEKSYRKSGSINQNIDNLDDDKNDDDEDDDENFLIENEIKKIKKRQEKRKQNKDEKYLENLNGFKNMRDFGKNGVFKLPSF